MNLTMPDVSNLDEVSVSGVGVIATDASRIVFMRKHGSSEGVELVRTASGGVLRTWCFELPQGSLYLSKGANVQVTCGPGAEDRFSFKRVAE